MSTSRALSSCIVVETTNAPVPVLPCIATPPNTVASMELQSADHIRRSNGELLQVLFNRNQTDEIANRASSNQWNKKRLETLTPVPR
ncbi:hypothetical protein N658DRAFT_490778 [Parathielavia hyrcaniae]|uniref:Uncharacterized protein n=1 Tax=Parathielavia hyrcaniae TaxID=113614 RepID=A0AAN6Q9Q1_9PEZI|nr:hypothetical protein N658DRAFT_490778 [Parathielavia hyrcaniae]